MLCPIKFYSFLKKKNINFYTGVPDSLLKNFCNYVSRKTNKNNHIIASNEGSAIAIASGYNIATGKIPLVYLQNSGLGNIINPILSLADRQVYGIPMIILVGWRGEPGKKDEPQHIVQGNITISLIKSLKKKYKILNGNEKSDLKKLSDAIKIAKKKQEPVFLIIKKNTFSKVLLTQKKISNLLSRESVIKIIAGIFKKNSRLVASTGMIARELYEIRKRTKENYKDFLTVGSMGYASQIAFGIALNTKKKIICLDGDGAFLMHMGAASTIGSLPLKNYIHIVLNNGAHDSVGGQSTTALTTTKLCKVVKACGYTKVFGPLKNRYKILNTLKFIEKKQFNSVFVEIIVKKGSRSDLGRPTELPRKNKENFFKNL